MPQPVTAYTDPNGVIAEFMPMRNGVTTYNALEAERAASNVITLMRGKHLVTLSSAASSKVTGARLSGSVDRVQSQIVTFPSFYKPYKPGQAVRLSPRIFPPVS